MQRAMQRRGQRQGAPGPNALRPFLLIPALLCRRINEALILAQTHVFVLAQFPLHKTWINFASHKCPFLSLMKIYCYGQRKASKVSVRHKQ
jgi:hypothetical protein